MDAPVWFRRDGEQFPEGGICIRVVVKKITSVATIAMLGLCLVTCGNGFIGAVGSYATLTRANFYAVVTAGSYAIAFGLPQSQKSVLSHGLCTRNLGAAVAPLFAVSGVDERAMVMVAIAVPLQMIGSAIAARVFARRASMAPLVI
jgi:bile acid:Na+ symporter, BASS family